MVKFTDISWSNICPNYQLLASVNAIQTFSDCIMKVWMVENYTEAWKIENVTKGHFPLRKSRPPKLEKSRLRSHKSPSKSQLFRLGKIRAEIFTFYHIWDGLEKIVIFNIFGG